MWAHAGMMSSARAVLADLEAHGILQALIHGHDGRSSPSEQEQEQGAPEAQEVGKIMQSKLDTKACDPPHLLLPISGRPIFGHQTCAIVAMYSMSMALAHVGVVPTIPIVYHNVNTLFSISFTDNMHVQSCHPVRCRNDGNSTNSCG